MADVERLRRIAYLMLSPNLGRGRRARLAAEAAERAAATIDPTATLVAEVLHGGTGRTGLPGRSSFPRAGDRTTNVVRDLAALYPAARVAFLLLNLERLDAEETLAVLRTAGVNDPETAVTVATNSPLDAALLRTVAIPERHRPTTARLVVGGVVVGAIAVAAPVIAVTTGGGDHHGDPVISRTVGDVRPGPQHALKATPAPAAPLNPAGSLGDELDQLLARLDLRLAQDHDPASRKKLEALRQVVLKRLAAQQPTAEPPTQKR